jgi:uncharacterized protein involved in response to NO
MIARVALGHTGRRIRPTRATVIAFALLGLAAVVRVAGVWIVGIRWPAEVAPVRVAHAIGAGLFITAFVLYLQQYARILFSPRADGRRG